MPWKDKSKILESVIKDDFIRAVKKWYPTSHAVIIPATHWRLLPYDSYVNWKGIMRAVEFKIDDHPVEAHQMQALYEVAGTGGYGFVVRWVNGQDKFVVDNFTTGEGRIFGAPPSERQAGGYSPLDIDDRPHLARSESLRLVIDYVMSFEVSPLESAIQDIIKRNYQRALTEKLGRIK